jgi:hypothetical protein
VTGGAGGDAAVEVVTVERPRAFLVEFVAALLQGGQVEDTRSRSTVYLTWGGRRAQRILRWKLKANELAAKMEKDLETLSPADVCRKYGLTNTPPNPDG